jgi:cytochrome c-type biogenesis protein CcmH/NrfG
MSDTMRCPDCGRDNPAGRATCQHCNFPLEAAAPAPDAGEPVGDATPGEPIAAAPREQAPDPGASAPAPAAEPPLDIPRPRPRPKRAQPANLQTTTLWLIFGVFAAMFVIWVAVKANIDRALEPVPGSNQAQQARAEELQLALAKDSTNIETHIALGDVYYDTGNWPDAIVHYRAAMRRDSTRSTVLVDLGVCYYNLGEAQEAERLFRGAIRLDPHQPVALFNLGIVHERRKEFDKALEFFHRSLQSDPPEAMRQPLVEAMQRVQEASGAVAPKLPDGR